MLDVSNIDCQRVSLARSAASERVRTSAWAITSPITVIRVMNSAGHSRVELNAPKPIAAITRPPTGSGMTSTERMPARRLYSAAAAASGGMSLSDRITMVRPARSSLANQLRSAGIGPRKGGSTPSTATEHRKYCFSSSTNSQKALRSKPRNVSSCFSALSISAMTWSLATFAKRAERSESKRSNARSSSSDAPEACLGVAALLARETRFLLARVGNTFS
jgi:hypothetical protein